MNPAAASEILRCLHVSCSPRLESKRLPGSRRQWQQTLEWLDHSGIALVFWQRLKELGQVSAIPSEVGERLERNLGDHRLRIAEMTAEFDSINQLFEGAHLKYAAMKGLALASDYCPNMVLRTTYDYDYLLPRESIATAQEVLRAAGYIRKDDPEEHPIVYFQAARPPRNPASRDDLYSKAFPRTVELHYLFWDSDQLKIPINMPADPMAKPQVRYIQGFWGRQPSPEAASPVRFYALSENMDLIFQVLHTFRHILRDWCRLCSLLDIAYFLAHRGSDAAFWDQFLDLADDSRPLSEIVGLVFFLASEVFGATIPSPVLVRTVQNLRRPLILWAKRYGLDSALNNFSDNKFSLFLHREFIPDAAAWREIRWSRLFPMQRPNQVFRAADSAALSRLTGNLKQAFYVAQRLKHHVSGAIKYGVEAPLWNRVRANR